MTQIKYKKFGSITLIANEAPQYAGAHIDSVIRLKKELPRRPDNYLLIKDFQNKKGAHCNL